MTIPGITDETNDPELLERVDKEAEDLLDELKEKVQVQSEELGPLRRKLTITVPEEVIEAHLKRNFDEIRTDAVVPGFRKGRAPIQLVQKRFGSDVRESLKTMILGQAFFAATGKQELEVLGDPLICIETDDGEKLMQVDEALQHITLPATGDFTFACEVEIKPSFELPELKGIRVKAPKVEVTDAMIDEFIERQCKIRGRYEPVLDGAAQPDDLLIAEIRLVVDGQEIKKESNVQLGVRGTRLDGISLENLGDVLKGVKVGQTVSIDCDIPADYERPDLRGKKGTFEFTIHEIKRLKPIEVADLVEQFGAESEQDLRDFIREDMAAEADRLTERAKREQVLQYLLDHTPMDLPEQLSARQTDQAVLRRVMELRQSGVPDGEIESRIDELRTSASEDVARDLKLQFIMEKVAEKLDVVVTDEEINSEIAHMARLYNQRFDRLRDTLHNQGLLDQLVDNIRETKCVRLLLEDAQFENVEAGSQDESADAQKDEDKKTEDKD